MMFIHALQSYLWNHVASFRIEKLGQEVIVSDLVFDENTNEHWHSSCKLSQPRMWLPVLQREDICHRVIWWCGL
jgi:tRNA(Glu) U13 pseudouridine synthase TruD